MANPKDKAMAHIAFNKARKGKRGKDKKDKKEPNFQAAAMRRLEKKS